MTDTRAWRAMWRVHFYAGIFAMPVLVVLAVTGLVILYADTVNDWQYGDLYRASSTEARVSLDDQREAVAAARKDWGIDSVTPPRRAGDTTVFAVSKDDGETVRNVYVDPSNGDVLGDADPGAGLVGLANRLHGFLNNDSVTVPVPVLAGILGDEPAFTPVPVGGLVMEVFAVWALALAATGLVLWWPRKKGTGRAMFVPRLGKKGRARWRDLHAIPGLALAVLLVFFVTTGMPWGDFWGANFSFLASKVTPNQQDFWSMDPLPSTAPTVGDLDRIGNRIPWATREDAVPTSSGSMPTGMDPDMPGMDMGGGAEPASPDSAATLPAPAASLDLVARAAREEGMLPGATIAFPADDLSDASAPAYGSYVVTNPWPSNLSDQGALFVDQFSARTLGRSTSAEWGAVQQVTEFGVQTHMGTQFGLVSRIAMTLGCVLVIWSSFSALVMWWKRRRTGLGFPRRPVDARISRAMIVVAVVLAVIYPLWGLSVLVVLGLDHLVIRRVGPLRRTFGMVDPAPPAPPSEDAPATPVGR